MEELASDAVRAHYDTDIKKKYGNDYEFNRWFKHARTWLDYHMTHRVIAHHLKSVSFNTCFELGPGPGTWSKLLYRHNSNAQFDLLDISEAMKQQFALEMRAQDNVTYTIADFLEYKPRENNYDLFFSSRALEYLPDKEKGVQKIGTLLKPKGTCIIITKNPHAFTLRKKQTKAFHTGQLPPEDLTQLLENEGFEEICVYPVIIRLPLIDRLTLRFSRQLFERLYTRQTDKLPRIAESYCVVCKKKS